MFGLGTTELIVIGVIVFLIFGAKRLPEIGKGLGGAIREFRQVKREISDIGEDNKDKGTDQKGGQNETPALENKLAEKVMEQVPGVKKVMDVKKKINRVKDIVD